MAGGYCSSNLTGKYDPPLVITGTKEDWGERLSE